MDKNMISIDDLLRQRLGGAEEKERPGAWANMKELLDKQMPEKPVPTGFNWRRGLGYFAAVLLLSTATVGGYHMISSSKDTDAATESSAASGTHNTNNNNNGDSNRGVIGSALSGLTAPDSKPDGTNIAANDNNTDNNAPVVVENDINTSAEDRHVSSSSSATNNVATTNQNISNSPNTGTNNTNTNNTSNNNRSNTPTVAVTNRNNPDRKAENIDAINSLNNRQLSANTESVNVKPVTAPEVTVKQDAVTNRNNNSVSNNTTTNKSVATTGNNQQVAQNTNTEKLTNDNAQQQQVAAVTNKPSSVAQNADNTTAKKKENMIVDSIPTIRTVETYSKKGTEVETTYLGKTARYREAEEQKEKAEMMTAANKPNVKANVSEEIKPQAAAPKAQNEENVEMVNLKDKKVASHKQKNFNPYRFEEMVQNAKFRMQRVKFYPGIVAGAVGSFGTKSMFGGQLGLSGELKFSDKLSLFTELKFAQRFNTGSEFEDSYISGFDSTYNAATNNYSYTYDSVDHRFNYTTSSSIELPIGAKYTIGSRFKVIGGANFAYIFPMNVSESDRPYQISHETAAKGNVNYARILSSTPQIKSTDFSSRFAIGYLLGAGYEMTPSTQIDLRLTQFVWDNAKTQGAKDISKQLFKTPNVQLNFIYRFPQKPYKK